MRKEKVTSFTMVFIFIFSLVFLSFSTPVLAQETDGDFTFTITDGNATIIDYDQDSGGLDVIIPATVTDGVEVYPVTGIGQDAFRGKNLTGVTIPDSVVTIGAYAFYVNNLGSLDIPNSVTSIGTGAFYNTELTSVTIGNSVELIGGSAFRDNDLLSVVIPDSVQDIANFAFYSNRNMTAVTIGNSVETIGFRAFGNNALESLIIPDSVKEIGNRAFDENNLAALTLGSGLETIGDNAFRNNELTAVSIPQSVITIGDDAFADNQTNSTDLTIYGKTGSEAQNYADYYNHTFIPYFDVVFKNYDDSILKEEAVMDGNDATAPDVPSRLGYTFTGWDTDFTNVTEDLEVTAQYNINQYTISFNSNEGSAVDSITADYGSTITVPTVPTREGYDFEGWYKEAALVNAWNFETDTVPAENITLYAKWTEIESPVEETPVEEDEETVEDVDEEESLEDGDDEELPQTGGAVSYGLGLLLLAGGAITLIKSRK